MKFFKIKDLLKSWSVWGASAVTVAPIVDANSGLFNFIPDHYKPLAVTALGLITLVLRAVKQTKTAFGKE